MKLLMIFLCLVVSIVSNAQWTVTTAPDYASTNSASKFGIGGTPAYKLDVGAFTNGTLSNQVVMRIRNTVPSNSYNGWGSAIEFYNNSNNIVSMASHNEGGAKIISEASEFGWQHNLKFRVVKNNSYSSQTGIDALILASDGVASFPNKVGIGTTNPGSYKLAVDGKVWAVEVNVSLTNPGPDYVFEKSYKLPALKEIQSYIEQHKHLPEVPSAKEMETNGIQVGEMNMILLKKIEELTLYIIDMEARMKELEKK